MWLPEQLENNIMPTKAAYFPNKEALHNSSLFNMQACFHQACCKPFAIIKHIWETGT